MLPTPAQTANLLHKLYHSDRTEITDARIDDLVTALTKFLPPAHPGPSIYLRAGSIQKLPLEITLQIFRFLSPVNMKAFCRSHKAAFQCLHDRKIASCMLQNGVIRPGQIGKCSAVTVNVLQSVVNYNNRQGDEALESAADGGRFDLVAQLLGQYSFAEHAVQPVLCAAAREKNVEIFSAAVDRMPRCSTMNTLAECPDSKVFQFSLVLNLLRTLSASDTRYLVRHGRSSNNDVPLSVITTMVGRDLNQEAVDCIYVELLCENNSNQSGIDSARSRRLVHIESLMSNDRFPVGGALETCVERGDGFYERYMRRWPLDRTAIIAALKRQLKFGRECVNASIGGQFDSNIAFLLSCPERPDWSQILDILRSFNVDDDVVWLFVNAVESHYDLSTMELTCSSFQHEILVSTYFPKAATDVFLAKIVSKLLANEEITAAQLPAFLDQNGDGKAHLLHSYYDL